jgi:hypothetical protein
MDPIIIVLFQVVRSMLSVQNEHVVDIAKLADNLQETEDDWAAEDKNKNSLFEFFDGRMHIFENFIKHVDPMVKVMQFQVEAMQKKLKEQDGEKFKMEMEKKVLSMQVQCLFVLVLSLVLERFCVYLY